MSLFPAYEKQAKSLASSESRTIKPGTDVNVPGWLSNSSFQTETIPQKPLIEILSDSSENDSVEILPSPPRQQSPIAHPIVSLDSDCSSEEFSHPVKRAKKHNSEKKHSKNRHKIKYEVEVENVYFEDRTRDRGNCNIESLCSRVRPRYNFKHAYLGFDPYQLHSKSDLLVQRYYAFAHNPKKHKKKQDTVIKRGTTEKTDSQNDDVEAEFNFLPNEEEQRMAQTKEFNEKIADSPHDVDLWLRYVKAQDTLHSFETYDGREINYAICQKKLSILETALERNPGSKELLREKLFIMGEFYADDEFADELEKLVSKDTGNVMLWQALIMATQTSVAVCTVSKVMNLYSRCFANLRQWSRTSSRNHDERLLEMLYQCFVFLRQAGMWEQMWEILRLNLSLNLGLGKETFRLQRSIDEKKLIEMEEVILTSRLPLNQLWLRVESLRENCHWLSVNRDELELIGDTHRFVSPEDVTDYVHPMITRKLNMRMAIYALMTLKVPLLPTSHAILQDLGLKQCSWTIDSIESLLAMLYPSIGELAGHKQRSLMLKGLLAAGLTSGPQYLRYHPAQEPYLDFVRDTFQAIAENLPTNHRTSLYVWWLRFERMLVYVCRSENKSEIQRKKLKGILKEFLKKSENRNNLLFYREYALIEREMGRFESCVNILQTAIESATISSEEDRSSLLSLNRTLLETLLDVRTYDESKKHRVLRAFSRLLPGNTDKNELGTVEDYLREFLENFLAESPPVDDDWIDTYFLPNSICDNIACYVYLLYEAKRDISEILSATDACLKHTREVKHLQERFHEIEIVVLQLLNERNRGVHNVLVERLNIALDSYPDNFYLLSVFAGIQSELPNWKIAARKGNNRPWQALTFCLAGRARINSCLERGITDAVTAAINKLIYFHRRLSNAPETRHCPLTWRLYMLLLREQNLSQEKGEDAYHESVTECPWVRNIYIDAAEVAPQLITQIQDIIREKDLRMHVTPEELDILRG